MGGSSSRPRSHRDHRPTTAAAATASVSSSSRPHRHRSKDSHHNSKGPWITNFPPSPRSADFTASTDKSVTSSTMDYNGGYHQHNQQYQQNANYNPYAYSADTAMSSSYQSSYHRPQEKDRRVIEAEKILGEIAKEYAAKRAAGLVPTKPVPARTLLWEELARNRTQAGRRGQCIFGRDTDKICGCTSYKKRRTPGQDNPGGVCECCNHGAVWHRLVGGTMARSSSRMSRSIMSTTHHSNVAGSVRGSKLETASSYVPSEARSSMYDYDSDDYDDDDEDDEDIANEMAVPSNYAHNPPPMPPPPYMLQQPTNFGFTNERASLLSVGSSFGFPSRLSSGTNSLGALLQAIQRYRDMGLDEDEIEMRIREDFPPVPRKSSVAARSDLSQSQIDI